MRHPAVSPVPISAIFLALALGLGLGLGWGLGSARAAEHGGEKSSKPEHKTTQSESFVMVEPIYTTIVSDNRAAGMLMVGAGLDIPDPAMRGIVERSMPVLRDAYIRNLMAFTANNVRTDSQPDVDMIAARLQGVTDRALKKKGAKVLMAQVAIRVTK